MTILRVLAPPSIPAGERPATGQHTPDHARCSHLRTGLATNWLTHGFRDAATTAHHADGTLTPATAHIFHDHQKLSPAAADTGRQHPATIPTATTHPRPTNNPRHHQNMKPYPNTRSNCPYCDSPIYGCGWESDETEAWQKIECDACGKSWHDVYKFLGYEEYN